MKYLKSRLLFVLLLLSFCFFIYKYYSSVNSSSELTGVYESVNLSLFEMPFAYLTGLRTTIGATLVLKPNSKFEYTTCGHIMTGDYTTMKDSLYLLVKENKYRIDSLNFVGFNGKFPTVPRYPITFKIDNKLLINKSRSKESNLESRLKKVNKSN